MKYESIIQSVGILIVTKSAWGVKKLAYDRLLTLVDRPQLNADVYQDFMVTNYITDITGTFTKGKTPLAWTKAGYTAGNIEISELGINARQTSQNSSTIVTVNYPHPNRTLITRLNRLPSADRTTIILINTKTPATSLACRLPILTNYGCYSSG